MSVDGKSMSTAERVDKLEKDKADLQYGIARYVARVVKLEAKVLHQESQIKWLRVSRDNWKLKANARLERLRKRAAA